MMNIFAETLMVASRMDSFDRTPETVRTARKPAPWAARVRRWLRDR